jgi:hypothetical protein
VHAGGVDPSVVEVEERAHRNGKVQRLVGPAGGARSVEIGLGDRRRVVVHRIHEAKERLVLVVERRRFEIGQDAFNERGVLKQFRRNCGVGFQSKRTLVSLGRVSRNQFTQPRTERRRPPQDLLREPREVFCCLRQVGEEMPDLRVLGAVRPHLLDQRPIRARLRVVLDIRQEHGFHVRILKDRRARQPAAHPPAATSNEARQRMDHVWAEVLHDDPTDR